MGSAHQRRKVVPITDLFNSFKLHIFIDVQSNLFNGLSKLVFSAFLWMGLCLHSQGQFYHTGDVIITHGDALDTILLKITKPAEDQIPDSTYEVFLDSNGTGSTRVLISPMPSGIESHHQVRFTYGPNPCTDRVVVEIMDKLQSPARVDLWDVRGQRVLHVSSKEHTVVLNTSHLSQGLYIGSVQTDGARTTFRLIKGNTDETMTPTLDQAFAKSKSINAYDADYELHYHKTGYVRTYPILLDTGINQIDLGATIMPWDTLFGQFIVRAENNVNRNGLYNVDLEIVTIAMNDVIVPDTQRVSTMQTQPTTPLQDRVMNIDTLGASPTNATADIKVSWPRIDLMTTADSLNPLIGTLGHMRYIGYFPGDTILTIQHGINPVSNTTVKLTPLPIAPLIGKRFLSFNIGTLMDGSPGSVNGKADSALIVIEHPTGIDSIYTDVNGYAITPHTYHHGDTVWVGFGFAGGKDKSGNPYKAYKGLDYVIEGINYSELVQGDTTFEISGNLIPDTLNSGLNLKEYVPAIEIIRMGGRPEYHAARHDTIPYFIDTTAFSHLSAYGKSRCFASIRDIADSISLIGPVRYVEVFSQIPNTANPYTASTFDYGANIRNGSHVTWNTIGINVKGLPSALVGAGVFVNCQLITIWKELVFRYTGHDPVTHRPSVMNVLGGFPSNLDIIIYTLKHNIEKEMFLTHPTQHMGLRYITDQNMITPR